MRQEVMHFQGSDPAVHPKHVKRIKYILCQNDMFNKYMPSVGYFFNGIKQILSTLDHKINPAGIMVKKLTIFLKKICKRSSTSMLFKSFFNDQIKIIRP